MPKNTFFFFSQNESTNIKKQRAHMPFFWSKKVKAHSPTFILFVKLCKKPIKKKKKMTLALFLQWGRLSWKTQQWHILYIVLSPLTLYWVLQGDQKQNNNKKSSCTKDNANKAKVCTRSFRTARPNQAVNIKKPNLIVQAGWRCALEKMNATKEGMLSMRKGFS